MKQKRKKLTYKQMVAIMQDQRMRIEQMYSIIDSVNSVINTYIDYKKDGDKFMEYLKKRKEALDKSRNESPDKKTVLKKESTEEK